MDFFCHFEERDIQRCPFLRNIDKPTSFSFSTVNYPIPVRGAIFENGPNFDMAFNLFHGKDGVVPLSGRSCFHDDKPEHETAPMFNPLAAKAATISLSAFGPGGPFSFDSFSEKWKKQKKKSESSKKREPSSQVRGAIFEDGPNFDLAFKLFHGKDGVVPLSGRSYFHDDKPEHETAPMFNPLAAKTATISSSAFGPGGPFSFDSFSEKWKKQKKTSESSKKREPSSQEENSSKLGNEWLETGNCPIAKSHRAVSRIIPLVAKALQPPPGMKLRCPPAIVAARAALFKTLCLQPLPAKMVVIGVLGMAANIPPGIWKEHARKFSESVNASVPFIAMLRKYVLMPKNVIALTIAAFIIGQEIGSRAERLRLKAKAERERVAAQAATTNAITALQCKIQGRLMGLPVLFAVGPLPVEAARPTTSSASVCF